MKKINSITLLVALVLMTNCFGSNKNNTNQIDETVNVDSLAITKLVQQVYEWHINNLINDFPLKYNSPSDTIFIGIDWEKFNQNIETLKKKDFFTDDFFTSYKNIALTIDSSIKKADIKWRNINDGIPLWDTDADNWCGCQDYPDNYWQLLNLDSLKIENDCASFKWTWDKIHNEASHYYMMTAKKVGVQWKISSIEGFKYFGSVEDYDKMMRE